MAKKIHNPHDNLFLQMMKRPEAAKDFFSLHLPEEIKAKIDLDSLQSQERVYTDAFGKGEVDTLYSANIAGKESYILLLCEHQSTSQRLMPLRLVEYILRIFRHHLAKCGAKALLPTVYPLIFYTGTKKYRHSTDFWQLCEAPELMQNIMMAPFRLVELMQVPDEDLQAHPKSGLTAYVMKHRKDADIVESLGRARRLLRNGGQDIDYFESILCYTIDQTETEHTDELIALFTDAVNENQKENLMTVAEKLREQGRQEGFEKGELKGKLKEKKDIATNLLKNGQDIQFIANITGLSLQEVNELNKAFT